MSNLKKTNEFSIELNGKIYGRTFDFEDAKQFARSLGKNAIVFSNGGVVYSLNLE